MGRPLDIEQILEPDLLAKRIAERHREFHTLRSGWIEEKNELVRYVFATDTKTTTNNRNGWSNSTTTPKLTQIYDNLKANYSAALFPSRQWSRWEADDRDSSTQEKKAIIQAYITNKLRQGNFEEITDGLLDDFILYGNCFATVEFATEYNEVEGEFIPAFVGPRTVRISPHDIEFDPTASSFENSPKIVRTLTSLGEVSRMEGFAGAFDRILENRAQVGGGGVDPEKSSAYVADGFSSIEHYYGSDYVELLTFYGDLYDRKEGILKENRKITIMDRAYVVQDEPIASWLGKAPIFHAGWRSRPDNLWAMGPLDNLVGLQYRIDHLENLKADVFDQIALPILKIRGDPQDFKYAPGERIFMGEEGDVTPLVPDTTALNADLQIQLLENKMEEMAGAPRQAMGIRTPGEKTAFEVETLQNAASRIFQHKASKFEREFIERVLNAMLEAARRNMQEADLIRVLDDETGATLFKSITKEDITARGKIVPVGARHFAERARRVQSITNLLQIKTDPSVGAHISGKEIARLLSEELGEEALFGENIAIREQAETQTAAQDTEANMLEELQVAAEQGL